jgi:hypothetical protein
MKMTIKKSEMTVMAMDRSAGKPIRQQSIQDTYGTGQAHPYLNPIGGFMGMHCYYRGRPEAIAHYQQNHWIQKEVLLMANNIPFQPMGNTVVVTAASSNTQGECCGYHCCQPGEPISSCSTRDKDNPVFVAYGDTANM